jgi:hypothetical protein
VDANQQFIRKKLVVIDELFYEVEVKMEAKDDAEQPEVPQEPELRLPSMYLKPGT